MLTILLGELEVKLSSLSAWQLVAWTAVRLKRDKMHGSTRVIGCLSALLDVHQDARLDESTPYSTAAPKRRGVSN